MKNDCVFVMYLMQNLLLIKLERERERLRENMKDRRTMFYLISLNRKFKCAKDIALHSQNFDFLKIDIEHEESIVVCKFSRFHSYYKIEIEMMSKYKIRIRCIRTISM